MSEVVYVAAKNHGGNGTLLHTDKNCVALRNARKALEKRRDTYPDEMPVCQRCRDVDISPDSEPDRYADKLEEMDPDDLDPSLAGQGGHR